jgi:uncharacterized protein
LSIIFDEIAFFIILSTILDEINYLCIVMSGIISRPEYLDAIQAFLGKETIIVLTGQRRVGKSYVMRDFRDKILETGSDNVIYIDKEKNQWDDIQTYKDLNNYLAQHYVPGKKNYILIDEAQEIEEFEKAVRNWRTEPNVDIVLTGSNAETLSSDLSNKLGARFHEIHIQSVTYKDFLRFHRLEDSDSALSSFIECGGLPGLVNYSLQNLDLAKTYNQDVLNTALLRDVILKKKIRNTTFLYNLLKFLADNTGKIISASSISKYMKGKDSPVSIDLVLNYLNYLCEAFIVRKVERFEIRGKKLLESNEKYYFEDHGIRNTLAGESRDKDIEKVIENVIYHQLIHDGYQVYVGQLNAGEVDFVCERKGSRCYIQASYLIASEDTHEREFGTLQGIKDNYPKYVISMNPLLTRSSDEGITHISLREFLLSGLSAEF